MLISLQPADPLVKRRGDENEKTAKEKGSCEIAIDDSPVSLYGRDRDKIRR
jgi:hypothetical protein